MPHSSNPLAKSLHSIMRISVIVITYNRLAALERVLSGLLLQDDDDFEILVGDDGSSPPAGMLVNAFKKRFGSTRLQYVYQPDDGFRAAELRNKCAAQATGDYLVFLDGDSVPRRNFLAGYRRSAKPGEFLFGRRVLVSQGKTDVVESRGLPLEEWGAMALLRARMLGHTNSFVKTVFSSNGRKNKKHAWKKMRSCNFGVWRSDFLDVNGFDEAYQGWGYEDSDLTLRLINHGVSLQPAPAQSAVLHLWHKEEDREFAGANWQRLEATMESGKTYAMQGVDQHLPMQYLPNDMRYLRAA